MPEGAQTHAPLGMLDPLEIWKRWYEAGTAAWTSFANLPNLSGSGAPPLADPWMLFLLWMRGPGALRVPGMAGLAGLGSGGVLDPREMWRQWLDLATGFLRKAAEAGGDPFQLTGRWLDLIEQTQKSALAAEALPADPMAFFRQWYDAANETWVKAVTEAFGTQDLSKTAGGFLERYTSYFSTLRQSSDEFLKSLQLATHSDITRVAGLVVALEEKVDRVEEALETVTDNVAARAWDAEALDLQGLEERVSRIERKLDRLLVALERIEAAPSPRATATPAARKEAAKGAGAPARKPRTTRHASNDGRMSARTSPAAPA